MKRLEDSQLATLARDGDSDAFAQLVNRYRDAIYGYCYWRTGNFEDARDLCQDTFIRAYTRLHQVREVGRLPAWLRTIAGNLCTRYAQGRRELPVAELPDDAESPRSSDVTDAINQALADLPEKERLAVVLHHVDGLSYSEIADFLDTSEAAIRNRLHRGRQMLKAEVLKMTGDTFEGKRLDDRFTFQTVMLAQSFTRLGLGWSPDGKYILCQRKFDKLTELWITDTRASDTRRISERGWQEDYGWSPDGRLIVYGYAPERDNAAPGSLHVYDVASGESRTLADGFEWVQFEDWSGWAKPVWASDSRRFALLMKRSNDASRRADAYIFSADTGECTAVAPELDTVTGMHPGDWSPDDSHFYINARATEQSRTRIWVRDLRSAALRPLTPEDQLIWDSPRCSPNGEWLAFTSPEGRSATDMPDPWIMRPDGSDLHRVASGDADEPIQQTGYWSPEWTADGRYIVCLVRKRDKARRQCDGCRIVDVSTGEVIPVLETDPTSDEFITGFRDKITRSPDGRRVAFVVAHYKVGDRDSDKPQYTDRRDCVYWFDIASRQLHLVRETRPDEDGTPLFRGGYAWTPVWSPDSRKLLFTEGTVVEQFDFSEKYGMRMVAGAGTVFDTKQGRSETRLCIADID